VTQTVAALIVAAGTGQRFGGALPKVFADLAGQPMFVWSLRAFAAVPQISNIVLAVAPEYITIATDICHRLQLNTPYQVISGGPRRQDSVRAGLHAMTDKPPHIVAIHDGARPLVTPEMITQNINVCSKHHAAVACVPLTDTVKSFADDGSVVKTLDRSQLRAIQTPQTFDYHLILDAHDNAFQSGLEVTDDASVLEATGHSVVASRGSRDNIKVTEREDLAQAAWIMRRRHGLQSPPPLRIGHGYDIHRLAPARPLILCGIQLPHDAGLLGHSDADVALHAIADAILGAAALSDIGRYFPDTDPRYENADSAELLTEVLTMAADAGWAVGNIDITIITEEPKLSPYRHDMIHSLAAILDVPVSSVSVKATTNEGLGPTGRAEAIACHAVAGLIPHDDALI
jgi:2-C-methyl-D-erythritol 4-phosphate cytidylyltransferase/2-C-methyl-D-erythritol 2,4-cyclodiphosphate synthase